MFLRVKTAGEARCLFGHTAPIEFLESSASATLAATVQNGPKTPVIR